MTYYVYILASQKNRTIYIGMSDDIERRIREHKLKEVKGFTKKYDIDKLVYFEEFEANPPSPLLKRGNSYDAFTRERQLK